MSDDKLDIYTKKQDEIKVTKENLPKICRLLVDCDNISSFEVSQKEQHIIIHENGYTLPVLFGTTLIFNKTTCGILPQGKSVEYVAYYLGGNEAQLSYLNYAMNIKWWRVIVQGNTKHILEILCENNVHSEGRLENTILVFDGLKFVEMLNIEEGMDVESTMAKHGYEKSREVDRTPKVLEDE